jgi:hypothetical protein
VQEVARYGQFLEIDATHNIWFFPMGFFLESWRGEKRLIWEKADRLKFGTVDFFLKRRFRYQSEDYCGNQY